jgi:hypothetical protein
MKVFPQSTKNGRKTSRRPVMPSHDPDQFPYKPIAMEHIPVFERELRRAQAAYLRAALTRLARNAWLTLTAPDPRATGRLPGPAITRPVRRPGGSVRFRF